MSGKEQRMSTDQQMQQAYQLIKQGRKEEAAALLVPIVRADNDNADAWWLLANAVNNADQAKRALQMVLRVRPDDERARRMLAKLSGDTYAPPPVTPPPRQPARPAVEDDPFAAPPPRTPKRSMPVEDDDPFDQPMTPSQRRAAAMDTPFADDPFADPPPESRPSKPAPRTGNGTQSKRSTSPGSTGSRSGTTPPSKRPPKSAAAAGDDPFAAVDDFDGDPFTELDLEGSKRSRRSATPEAVPERRRSPALAIIGLLLVVVIAVGLAFVVLNQTQNQPGTTTVVDPLTMTAAVDQATAFALGTPFPGMDETLAAVAADPEGALTAAAELLANATLEPGVAETLTAVGLDPAAAMTSAADMLANSTLDPGVSSTLTAVGADPAAAMTSAAEMLANATVESGIAETLTAVGFDPEGALTAAATTSAALAETLSPQLTPGPNLSDLTRPPSLLLTASIPDAQQTAFANAAQVPGIVETLTAQPNALETPANAIVMTMVAQATAGLSSEAILTPVATMIAGGMGSTLPSGAVDQGSMSYGETVSQNLPDQVDHSWSFTGEAGDIIIIDLVAVKDMFDPQLVLFDPSGTAIAENDDVDLSQNNRSSHIEITLPESGTYSLLVSAFGGESGDYELSLKIDG